MAKLQRLERHSQIAKKHRHRGQCHLETKTKKARQVVTDWAVILGTLKSRINHRITPRAGPRSLSRLMGVADSHRMLQSKRTTQTQAQSFKFKTTKYKSVDKTHLWGTCYRQTILMMVYLTKWKLLQQTRARPKSWSQIPFINKTNKISNVSLLLSEWPFFRAKWRQRRAIYDTVSLEPESAFPKRLE